MFSVFKINNIFSHIVSNIIFLWIQSKNTITFLTSFYYFDPSYSTYHYYQKSTRGSVPKVRFYPLI